MNRHPLTAAIVLALEPPLVAEVTAQPNPIQEPLCQPTWFGIDYASEPDATFFESISIQNEVPRCPGCGVRSDLYGCWCSEMTTAADPHTPPALTLEDIQGMARAIGLRPVRRRWDDDDWPMRPWWDL